MRVSFVRFPAYKEPLTLIYPDKDLIPAGYCETKELREASGPD
jgi:hypothetical protein